ncbi:MAG: DUF6457 domain-containing protein [Thermoleophilaceae bacterium]
MDPDAWIEQFAAELGVAPPTEAERDALLALAGVAAHASERRAAPIACWIASRAGRDPEAALAAARALGSRTGAEGS